MMNKRIYLLLPVLVIIGLFIILFISRSTNDNKRILNKEKKAVYEEIVINLNVYKDEIPLKMVRIKPVTPVSLKGKISYRYRWYVNGEEQENNRYILYTSLLKKGDTIYCRVLPEYKNKKLKEIKTETITIPNSPPRIIYSSIGEFKVPGTFKYQIHAEDPDEDDITYMLIEPLDKNIMIDSISGEISWEITESMVKIPEIRRKNDQFDEERSDKINIPVDGKEPISYIKIKFKVTDSEGAVTLGEIYLDLKKGKEIKG